MQEEIRDSVERKNTVISQKDDVWPSLNLRTQHSYSAIIAIFQQFIEIAKQNPEMDEYLQEIEINAQYLIQKFTRIINIFGKLHSMSIINKNIYYTLNSVWQHLQIFLTSKNLQKLNTKGKAVWLIEIQTKITCCLELMLKIKSIQDITNTPKELFPHVWEKITFQSPKNMQSFIKDMKKAKKLFYIVTSAVINYNSHSCCLPKILSFGLSFPRYMMMPDSGKLRSFRLYRTPTIELLQDFWNLFERGALKQFVKIAYRGIRTNRKIYLPVNGEFNSQTDVFACSPDKITVRMLYSKKIHIFQEGEPFTCCISKKNQLQFIETVIIHLHGGGFVALSSRSSQIYTRQWANELNVPIFSVDYRTPPYNPFPDPINDCLVTYEFLLNHIHKYVNIRPKYIYVAGESAGGNLACALTGLILKKKLLKPRGLYVAYPAIDLRLNFTLSRVYALTDVLIWPSLLLLCLKQYLKNDIQNAITPLASPILIDEQYVNGTVGDKRFPLSWPKTMITVGSRDPFLDDSLVLMQKMVQSKIQCSCVIYEGFPHGYLNTPMLIDETKNNIRDSIEHLKRMIDIKRERI